MRFLVVVPPARPGVEQEAEMLRARRGVLRAEILPMRIVTR